MKLQKKTRTTFARAQQKETIAMPQLSLTDARLPIRLVLSVLVATFFIVCLLLWQNAAGILSYQKEESQNRELIWLSGQILVENEALTNTARMFGLTGEMKWKEDYERAKQTIGQHFTAVYGLAPDVISELAESLESSSDYLQEIEASSGLLQLKGYTRESMDLLISPEYIANKARLRSVLRELEHTLQQNILATEVVRRNDLWTNSALVGLVLLGLFACWFICLGLLQSWKTKVDDAIAKRVAAESELLQQERFLDTIIQNLPLAIFAKDVKRDYMWTMWNRKAEELFGLKAVDVIGTSDFDHFSLEEATFFRNTDRTVMNEGKVVEVESESITTSRGTWLGHTIKLPIYDDEGKPSILLGMLEDITVRKQQADRQLQNYSEELEQKNDELEEARSHAEAADRAKTEFLATMSHEIRTPLNGVIGTADLLSRTQLSAHQDDYVQTIRKSGETLLYVINDILDITKLQAQQLGLEKIGFDFSRTIEDVVDIHSSNAAKKELDLLLRYAPGTPARIMGDPGRLRQILNNLINNAIKFTENGHIMVDVEARTDDAGKPLLRISVRDTGIGIAAEHQEKIFDRFTQAETSTNRKYGGSGLGLSICKQLVELMGGTIGIESVVGKSSTFWFTLPLEIDQTPIKPLDIADLNGVRVMLVDDNDVNLRIMVEQLNHWGCVPRTFISGDDALLAIEKAGNALPFDLAIIDHDMPGMSGAMLGENLRAHPLTADMPLLAFSSRGMRGDASYFEENGFNGYLVKPSHPEDIRIMLAAMLHHRLGSPILTRHYLNERLDPTVVETQKLGLSVLVVEDDAVNQKVVRMMLEELGCEVYIAANGPLGVQAYGVGAFDFIFMDMQMPGMDGPEAARTIRVFEQAHGRARTPIVALTANAMAEHRDLCLAAGMDDYMTKPITQAKLYEKIKQFAPAGKAGEALPPTLSGFSAAQMAELRDAFNDTAAEMLEEMEQALLFDDTDRWRRAAHRLKGASMNLGYSQVEQLCREAEDGEGEADKDLVFKNIQIALAKLPR